MAVEVSVPALKPVAVDALLEKTRSTLNELLHVSAPARLAIVDGPGPRVGSFGTDGHELIIGWEDLAEVSLQCFNILIDQDGSTKRTTVLSAGRLRTDHSLVLLCAAAISYSLLTDGAIEDDEGLFKLGGSYGGATMLEQLKNPIAQDSVESACRALLQRAKLR